MKSKCVHDDLISYLDNELSVEKKILVEKHLDESVECRNFLSYLQKSLLIIENEKVTEISPFFYTRLSAQLDKSNQSTRQILLYRLIQPVFFSILLIIGILGGIKLGINASSLKANQQSMTNTKSVASMQMINDFATEPIETFLLDKL